METERTQTCSPSRATDGAKGKRDRGGQTFQVSLCFSVAFTPTGRTARALRLRFHPRVPPLRGEPLRRLLCETPRDLL